jgi:hypothetical protein
MRAIIFILVLGTLRLACVTPATAQTAEGLTAGNLRDACENLVLAVRGVSPISQEDPGAMLCLGYLAGWSQAMESFADKPYCLPKVATMQPGDLADLLVTFVDGDPDRQSSSAHAALLETLVETFPCAEAADPEDGDGVE